MKKFSLASATIALFATPAFANNLPNDFATLDKDGNGTVTFAEYQMHTQALGLSTTQAAQDFTHAAQGDALLTEEELNLALAFADQPYALQSFTAPSALTSEPQPLPVAETVETAPMAVAAPISVETPPVETESVETEETPMEPVIKDTEVSQPPPTEPELIEDSVTETTLEDVMGEVETYESESEIETPAEEGVKDILEDEEPIEDPS